MEYIVDFKPYKATNIDLDYYSNIENRISKGEAITENEAEEFLRTIIFLTREKINPSLDNYDFKCDLAQSILGDYLERINCPTKHCSTLKAVLPTVVGHNFSVATLNVEGEEKSYLLDATYIQFFKQDQCRKDKYLLNPANQQQIILTPDPGYFIKEEDQDAADFLLRYGYIELTPEYAKMYGDSFYNTKTGFDPHPLNYKELPGSMYLKMFSKGEEQLSQSHEKLAIANKNLIPFSEQKRTNSRLA